MSIESHKAEKDDVGRFVMRRELEIKLKFEPKIIDHILLSEQSDLLLSLTRQSIPRIVFGEYHELTVENPIIEIIASI